MAWTAPRTWVTGELVTSTMMNVHLRDNLNYLYSTTGELTYNEFTSTVVITATTEATATVVVTATTLSFDGVTPVEIEFQAPEWTTAVASSASVTLYLYEGSGSIGEIAQLVNPASGTPAAGNRDGAWGRRRFTPASGSKSYSIRGAQGGGNGSVSAGAGGNGAKMPGSIVIRRTS